MNKRNCGFGTKVIFGECENHYHDGYRFYFWLIVGFMIIASLITWNAYNWYNSSEYEQEVQEWQFLQERAGCNDLKVRMDEILIIKSNDRNYHEGHILEYIQERYTWSCSSDVVALGK